MNWFELIKNIGYAGILSAAVAWLTKQLIVHFFSKDLETFKSDLEKEAFSFRIQYEKMHSERAEVTKELYKKIVRTYRSFYSFMHPFQMSGDLTEKEKGEIAAKHANDFTDYYEENRIFVDEKLAVEIDKLSNIFREAWRTFDISRRKREQNTAYVDEWDKAWKIISEITPEIKKNIEKKFRKIIGISK